jgi:hypothetical protein
VKKATELEDSKELAEFQARQKIVRVINVAIYTIESKASANKTDLSVLKSEISVLRLELKTGIAR